MRGLGIGIEHLIVTALILLAGAILAKLLRTRMRSHLGRLHRELGVLLETIAAAERWALLVVGSSWD